MASAIDVRTGTPRPSPASMRVCATSSISWQKSVSSMEAGGQRRASVKATSPAPPATSSTRSVGEHAAWRATTFSQWR